MTSATQTATANPAPSGEQWCIEHGEWRACIVEVGGSVRTLTHAGQPVLVGYDENAKADAARGHILTPWPNRIRDGKYPFDGSEYQLALTDPGRHNASHGLTHWSSWAIVKRSDNSLTVGTTVHPQPGWDWTLRLTTTYTLDDHGLTVTAWAQNLSDSACPFGWGAHPYLTTGEATLDEVTVTAPVAEEIVTDEQLIPVSTRPANPRLNTGLDLAGTGLDTGYRVAASTDGRWSVTVARTADPSNATTLWADAAFGYLQVFTGDGLPQDRRRCSGLAVEPMTCPANAFNSGEGLIVLAPGQEWTASFGIGR